MRLCLMGNGGYPIQSWLGGTPSSAGWWGRVPHPVQTLNGILPSVGWGTTHPFPPVETWDGVAPPFRPGMRYLSPSRCGLTNKLETVPSPILRMRAVKIGSLLISSLKCHSTNKTAGVHCTLSLALLVHINWAFPFLFVKFVKCFELLVLFLRIFNVYALIWK